MMKPHRLVALLLALTAALVLLAPTVSHAASFSWATLHEGWGIDSPDIFWPNVVWCEGQGDIWLRNLETSVETPISVSRGALSPMCTSSMVVWTEQPTSSERHTYARFLESGVTKEIPLRYGSTFDTDASGAKIADFRSNVTVYDCEAETETIVTFRLSAGGGVGAMEGDRVVWAMRPSGAESTTTIHVYDLSTGVESVVATSPHRIQAIDVEGDTIVYSTAKDSDMMPGIYALDLSTAEDRLICRTAGPYPWSSPQLTIQGRFVTYTDLWTRMVSIDTGSVHTVAIRQGYYSWVGFGDHVVFADTYKITVGTLDAVAPVTTSDAQLSYLGSAEIHLTATDTIGDAALGHTYYSLDGGAPTEGVTAPVATSGDHEIEFWSVDEIGNEELPHNRTSFSVSPAIALYYAAGAGGRIDGALAQIVPVGGSADSVTAVPNAGYHFVSWSDGVTTATRTDSALLLDLSVAAVFAADPLPKAAICTPHAPSTMSRSRYYTIYGYLKPRHASGGYPVRIYRYRYVSGHWKSYGFVNAKASNYSTYTRYSRSIKLPYRGKWKVRAYAPADSGHSAAWSSGSDYITVN